MPYIPSLNIPAFPIPILRVARPTQNLDSILDFYIVGLGLTLIASFDNHSGFDGRVLAPQTSPGTPAPWHLEFTYQHGSDSSNDGSESVRAPTRDNLLVLYVPDEREWEARRRWMEECGYAPVEAVNPYWEQRGVTYEDPEGWRVVLARMGWTT